MLKPGYSKQEQNSSLGQKLDTDLDPVSIPRENFDQLFQTQVAFISLKNWFIATVWPILTIWIYKSSFLNQLQK